jgi:hypothetical protein
MRTTRRTEPLMPIVATRDELIAIGAAITTYRKWLARTPESAVEHREGEPFLCCPPSR